MGGRIILDLCGGTGAWSRPYAEAGYDVRLVTLPEQDVRLYDPPEGVHGILAAPPCTEFASSGARWWASKPQHLLDDAIEVARACLRIIEHAAPWFWALENPVGRLARCVPELGAPLWKFDPCDYGEPYTKKTYLWGRFTVPAPLFCPANWNPVEPAGNNPIHYMPPGPDRQKLRSITPAAFARAFFEANP